MITENKEERLKAIIEFIKQNKKSDRVVTLVNYFGQGPVPTALLAWNEIESRQAIYFDTIQASSVFMCLLLAYGEAVGFCRESEPYPRISNPGIAMTWGLGNTPFDDRREGMETGIPIVRNISFGKCITRKNVFNNGLIYELEVKVDGARDYREEIQFCAREETRKELLAELLYPIVTLGLDDNVNLTYEFVEAFIGWFQREDI